MGVGFVQTAFNALIVNCMNRLLHSSTRLMPVSAGLQTGYNRAAVREGRRVYHRQPGDVREVGGFAGATGLAFQGEVVDGFWPIILFINQ